MGIDPTPARKGQKPKTTRPEKGKPLENERAIVGDGL